MKACLSSLCRKERGEVDPRGPTLGAVHQEEEEEEVTGVDVQPHLLVQQGGGSSSEKASYSVRISVIQPDALGRPSGSCGSERLESTRWTLSGRWSTKKATDL